MLSNGVQKNLYHLRDYSQERTFGAFDPKDLPEEYNADLGYDFPDQIKDGYPNGCTGYTQTETGQDEYGIPFDPSYVYKKTLFIEDLPEGQPCKIRDSLKATTIYGLQPRKGGNPFEYRRGQYFDVDKVGDYFDGVRSALWTHSLHKRTISAGSPWFREWMTPLSNGLLKAPKKYVWDLSVPGHNYKICGWKSFAGVPVLILKPWLGPSFGDRGYVYVSRDVFNRVMNISGTFMYIQANAGPEYIQTVKLDIQELILALCKRILNYMALPTPPKPPISPATESNREKLYTVAKDCIGQDLTPNDEVPDDVACVAQLQEVFHKAFGQYIGTGAARINTLALKEALQTSPLVNQIAYSDRLYGDICVFATGEGKDPKQHGHVFVVGKQDWMSNDSTTGLWKAHWSFPAMERYFIKESGFPPHVFRLK